MVYTKASASDREHQTYPQIIPVCDTCLVGLDGTTCKDCAIYKPLPLGLRVKKCAFYAALWLSAAVWLAVYSFRRMVRPGL
jgi:hypothetical protein